MRRIMLSIVILNAVLFSPLSSAHADNYSIKNMTSKIQEALDNRRGRYEMLTALKAEGSVGETNDGYLKALRDGGQVQSIVEAENKDREVIYRAIVEQNDLRGALDEVEKVFAKVQRDKAEPGDYIQLENGSWVQK